MIRREAGGGRLRLNAVSGFKSICLSLCHAYEAEEESHSAVPRFSEAVFSTSAIAKKRWLSFSLGLNERDLVSKLKR